METRIFVENKSILDPSFVHVKKNGDYDNLIEHLDIRYILDNFFGGVEENTSLFISYFKKHTNNYPLLTKKLFKTAIEIKLYQSLPELFSSLQDNVKDFILYSNENRDKLSKQILKKTSSNTKKLLTEGYRILNCNVGLSLNKNIDIQKIMYEFKLTKTFPYISYGNVIKVFENFDYKDIIKKMFKDRLILIMQYFNLYTKIYLTENGGISIKYNFKKEHNVTFDNVEQVIKNTLSYLLSFLKISDPKIQIKYTIISFGINKILPYEELQSHIKNIFVIQPRQKKDVLKLKYNDITSLVINSKLPITKVTVYGITKKQTIISIMDNLVEVYNTIPGNIIYNKPSVKVKIDGIDSVSCQKFRQPVLIGNKTVYTYSLEDPKTKTVFVCENPAYKYPGFTSKGSICCFKKDQRDKNAYKKNIGIHIKNLHVNTDAEILKSAILKTNKVIEDNRIGVFSKIKNSYRLGNTNGILGAVRLLLRLKDIPNINEIISVLNDKVYQSLDNGELHIRYALGEYKKLLLNHEIQDGILELTSIWSKCNFLFLGKKNVLFIGNNTGNIVHVISNCLEPIIRINSDRSMFIRYFYLSDLKDLPIKLSPLQILSSKVKIKNQYTTTKNGRVIYILCNYGIIPVKESGILRDYPVTPVTVISKSLLTLNLQYKLLVKLGINVKYQFSSNDGKDIEGFVLKNNNLVPTKKSKIPIKNLATVYRQFIVGNEKSEQKMVNDVIRYGMLIDMYKEIYERIRYLLSKIDFDYKNIDNTKMINLLKEHIVLVDNINLPSSIPTTRYLCSESNADDPFCYKGKLKIPKGYFKGMVSKIVSDIANMTLRGQEILSHNVKTENFDGKFIKRSAEKIKYL